LSAISFAAPAHRDHFRKDGATPYIAHPFRVATILSTVFGVTDLDTLIAAVLHDTIEDTRTDHDDLSERFGARAADYVAALSKDTRLPEEQREREYHDDLAAAPVAVKLCKLADVYDNLLDSRGMDARSRRKTIGKAHEALERFTPALDGEWPQVLAAVREAIAQAERELAK
jgi:guanosine-3',5'-bis(diphosphate) 3'-pyrophosphohydrolase